MTLTASESHVGSTALVSDINKSVLNFLVKSNFHQALDAAITLNTERCGSSIFCQDAYYTPLPLRRELSRQSAGLLSLIMDTSLWRMLEVATVIWGSYALISGLVY